MNAPLDGGVIERIGRYSVERLIQKTGLSEVYLARDPAGTRVCIKRPLPERVAADPEMAMRFHREGVLLGNVHHANIVRVFEVGDDAGAPFLCLEYVEGRSLEDVLAGGPCPIREGLSILREIALGLAEVHDQGIVHADLKPGNVLVTESGDGEVKVKIVDFGLAVQEGRRSAAITGTLRYMAPEQTPLVDWPIDASTDLYSLGAIAFEMFTGQAPFTEEDPARLLAAHVSAAPPRPGALRHDLPLILGRIILKLLEKVPARRYRTAVGLARDLETLDQRLRSGEASPEFVLDTHGDSPAHFNKVFVGRAAELAELTTLTNRARADRLTVAFIAGVAGVGKSSLVREFRNRSLTGGLQFAIGKCREVARGIPYYVLTEAFADYFGRLAEAPEATREAIRSRVRTALGEHRAELVALFPAFATVFTDDGAARRGEGERAPLLHLLTQTLHAIATTESPLVLFLDDLQWADAGAREAIALMVEGVGDAPVLVVGTYRSEEVGPDHPLHLLLEKFEENKRTRRIHLKPLDVAQTALLVSESLRLPLAGLPSDLTADIHRIAGGNALFIIEVIKALVASGAIRVARGQLVFSRERFVATQLPTSLVDVVSRRVEKLDRADLRVLRAAALVGRGAPLALISAAAKVPSTEAFAAAQVGLREQLLDYGRDGLYRFAHDRIQQACAGLVPEADRQAIHGRIVDYLETQTDDDPDRAFVLAEHAARAGDAARAWKHCRAAATLARERNTTEQVLTYGRRAIEHGARCGAADSELRPLRTKIAEALELLGRDGESLAEYEALLADTSDRQEKAQIVGRLAYLSQKASKFGDADRRLAEALALLDLRISDKGIVFFGWLLYRWSLLRARLFGTLESTSRSVLIVEILSTRIACILWSGVSETGLPRDVRQPLYLAYRLLAEAERYGVSREATTANRLVFLPIAQQKRPAWGAAKRHLLRAQELAKETGFTLEVGLSRIWLAIALCWSGQYREALHYLPGAMDVLRSTGNMIQLSNVYIYSFWASKGLGQLEVATANARALLELGERIRRPAMIANACLKLGDVLHLRGDFAAAETYLTRGCNLAEERKLANEAFHGEKIRGEACIREHKYEEARRHFDVVIQSLARPGMWMYQAFVSDTYFGYAEAALKDPGYMASIGGVRSEEGRRIKAWITSGIARERHLYVHLGYGYRVLGLLRRQEGRAAASREAFLEAERILTEQERPIEAGLALLDAATALRRDFPGETTGWLQRARVSFQEHDSPPLVGACDRLLAAMGAQSSSSDTDAGVGSHALEELIKIGQTFVETRDTQILLERIVDAAVELLNAERGFVFTRAADGAPLEFCVGKTAAGQTLTAGEAQISMGVVARVDESGHGAAISDTRDDAGLRNQQSVVAYNVRSVLCVPLTQVGQRLGVVYLDNQITKAIYGNAELELLQTLAAQASVALVNASQFKTIENISLNLDAKVHERTQELELANVQLASTVEELRNTTLRLTEARREALEKEMAIARTIQTSMVPSRELINVRSSRFCGAVLPAGQCGGDIWTFTDCEGKVFFFLGDVTGHGVGPAMVTAMARSCVDTLVRERRGKVKLDELLNIVDEVLSRMIAEQVQMTAAAVEVDFDARRLSLCSAAHEPMILLDTSEQNREPRFVLEPSLPLGRRVKQDFVVTTIDYDAGDRLVLFTDGLVEQENRRGAAFGLRRLTRLLTEQRRLRPDDLLTLVLGEVDRFGAGTPQADDVSLIIIDLDATRPRADEPIEAPVFGPG